MSFEHDLVERIHDLELPGYGDDELNFMAQTMAELEPDFIGDWGTNRGSSARIFYEGMKLLGKPCWIVTVDLPIELAPLDRDHAGEQTNHFVGDIAITCIEGDGVTEALTEAVFHQAHRPLFFLDGDHSAENVYREISLIHRIYPQAVMLIHDTSNQEGHQIGPGRAIEWWLGRHPESYTPEVLVSQAGMTRLWPNQ